MTVYRPREIEFEKEAEIKAAETKRKIQAEKDQAIADRLAFQDSMMNKLPAIEILLEIIIISQQVIKIGSRRY